MTKKLIIYLPQEEMDYLQGLQYEVDGLEKLMTKLTRENVSDDDMVFWKDSFIEAFTKLSVAKEYINDEYIRPSINANEKVTWNANFSKGCIEVFDYNEE